jgi:hypothetical protein
MPVSYTFIEPHQFAPLSYTDEDTSLINTHYFDDLLHIGQLYQTLGIPGQAHQTINFDFHRHWGFTYLNYPYPLLMMQQEDLKYYKVETAYTRLAYTYGFFTEMDVEASHAQRVGPVNFGFNLKGYTNEGDFVNQMSKHFTGTAYLHYELPSQRYGFRIGYIYNRINCQENSGMVEDTSAIYNYAAFLKNEEKTTASYAFNTPSATSRTVSNDLLLQQYVNLKFKKEGASFGYLTHSFQYKAYKSSYTNSVLDTLPDRNFYFSKDTTADTLSYYHIINTLQWSTFYPYHEWDDKKNFFHMAFGLTHECMKDRRVRTAFLPPDSITGARDTLGNYSSNSDMLFGGIYIRLFSVMDITGRLSYTFSGYNSNDATANATVSWAINRKNAHFIGFTGHYYRISPDYVYTYFSGNELRWDTTWHKQSILRLGAYWSRKNLKVDFNYFWLNNYAYFGQDLKPNQLKESANVLQFHFSSPMRIKNFGFNANLYLQYSDNEFIPVPIFAGKASIYYIFNIFKKKMRIQVQADLMYNTPYQAYGYSPMLRQFYDQEGFDNGKYLYLDANFTFQVSRLCFFFRASNLLAGIMGYNYFTTPYYPMEGRRFQIGINWRFYD